MVDAYGSIVGHWRAHVVAGITSEGQDYVDIHSEVRLQSLDGWSYSSLNGNYGASIAGQTNRGSSSSGILSVGVNAEQTLISKDLRISKSHALQIISFDGYVNITGIASGSSSAVGYININPIPSHKVTYNANGGSGAPLIQTKWYGESLFLSNGRPTRSLYEFQGWTLTQGSSKVDYRPGQQWLLDEDHTLYAVWKRSAVAPKISDIVVYRCNSDGIQNNLGTSAKVTVSWSVDTQADSANKAVSMTILYDGVRYTDNMSGGTSGVYTKVLSGAVLGTTHSFTATIRDTHLTASASTFLGPASFLIDIAPNGKGLGIGQAAPEKAVAIGGMFFANSLNELPHTASDVGGPGTLAIVHGRKYMWDGYYWVTDHDDYPLFTWYSTWGGAPATSLVTEATKTFTIGGNSYGYVRALAELGCRFNGTGEYGMRIDINKSYDNSLVARWGMTTPQKSGGTVNYTQSHTLKLFTGIPYTLTLTTFMWGSGTIVNVDNSGNSGLFVDPDMKDGSGTSVPHARFAKLTVIQ